MKKNKLSIIFKSLCLAAAIYGFHSCMEESTFNKRTSSQLFSFNGSMTHEMSMGDTMITLRWEEADLDRIKLIRTEDGVESEVELKTNSYVERGLNSRVTYTLQSLESQTGTYSDLAQINAQFAKKIPFGVTKESESMPNYNLRITADEIENFRYEIEYKKRCGTCQKILVENKIGASSGIETNSAETNSMVFPVLIQKLEMDEIYDVEITVSYNGKKVFFTEEVKIDSKLPESLKFSAKSENIGATQFDAALSWENFEGFEGKIFHFTGSDCTVAAVSTCDKATEYGTSGTTRRTLQTLEADLSHSFVYEIKYKNKIKRESKVIFVKSNFPVPKFALKVQSPGENQQTYSTDATWDAVEGVNYSLYRYDNRDSSKIYATCNETNVETCGAEKVYSKKQSGAISKSIASLTTDLKHDFVMVASYGSERLTATGSVSKPFKMSEPSLSGTKTYENNRVQFKVRVGISGDPGSGSNISRKLIQYTGTCSNPEAADCKGKSVISKPVFPKTFDQLGIGIDHGFYFTATYTNPHKSSVTVTKSNRVSFKQDLVFDAMNFKGSRKNEGNIYYDVGYSWKAHKDINYGVYLVEGTNSCALPSINTCTASNKSKILTLNSNAVDETKSSDETGLTSENRYRFILDARYGDYSKQEVFDVSKDVVFPSDPKFSATVSNTYDASYDVELSWDSTTDYTYEIYLYEDGKCTSANVENCTHSKKQDVSARKLTSLENGIGYRIFFKTLFDSKESRRNYSVKREIDMSDWEQVKSPAPWTGRSHFGSVVHDGKIWVIGGKTKLGKFEDGTSDVWVSADGANFVKNSASLTKKRYESASVVFGNQILMIAGINDTSVSEKEMETFDGTSWKRSELDEDGDLKRHQGIAFNGAVYVLGGDKYNDTTKSSNTTNQIYKFSNGSWQVLSPTTRFSAREDLAAVVFNNELYVLGGFFGSASLGDVWKMNANETWTRATASAKWSTRSQFEAVAYAGKIWVLGGLAGSAFSNGIFSSENGSAWAETTPSNVWKGRRGHRAVVFKGRVYVMGGIDSNGTLLNDVWRNKVVFNFKAES